MKISSLMIVAGLLSAIATSALSGPPESSEALFSPMKQRVEQQCASYEQRANEVKDELQRDEARLAVSMFCDCLPRELDRLERNYDGSNVGKYIAQKGVKASIAFCGAQQLRQQMLSSCEREAKLSNGKADPDYCSCFKKGLSGLSDTEVAQSAKDEYEIIKEKSGPASEDQPAAAVKVSALAKIDQSCRVH